MRSRRETAMSPSTKLQIQTNVLLEGPERTVSLEAALVWKRAFANVASLGTSNFSHNLQSISEWQLKEVNTIYGPSGLYKLVLLSVAESPARFTHFWDPVISSLSKSSTYRYVTEYDNAKLPQANCVNGFNSNVLMPALSRDLYNPGCRHGTLVYGLGGPKILISHSFRDVDGEISCESYRISAGIIRALMARGYTGTFLFIDDYFESNLRIQGYQAPLLWFSMISVHSDMVIFVRGSDEKFGRTQKKEIEVTPDRVQKKIVDIPREEVHRLRELHCTNSCAVNEKGASTSRLSKMEAHTIELLLREYVRPGWPNDRLIKIEESGKIREYPLEYRAYRFSSSVSRVLRDNWRQWRAWRAR